ncbi:MAG: hypothetical protein Q8N31_15955 [Reyranella sp.]|nr:hypothetical protein [Reyranella sp.]
MMLPPDHPRQIALNDEVHARPLEPRRRHAACLTSPSLGQGAVCIECRIGDTRVRDLLAAIDAA